MTVRVFEFPEDDEGAWPARRIAFDPATLEYGKPGTLARNVVPDAPPKPKPARVSSIVIVPTNECNLACSYCYVQGEGRGAARRPVRGVLRRPGDLMADRTVCRALDLIESPDPHVSFFGGEPLLGWGRLRWAVERAQHRFPKPRFHITTNGTLFTQQHVEYLAIRGFSMIVSLDGPPELHDAHRRDAAGFGTYGRVRNALDLVAAQPELLERHTRVCIELRPVVYRFCQGG